MLDTSICVELIRRRSSDLLAKVHSQEPGSIGISSITLAELQYGVERSSDPGHNLLLLLEFIADIQVRPFGRRAAFAYGRVRAGLERAGTPIGSLDMLIGSHALALHVTLVTANEREFRRIRGLRVENWAVQ